MDICQPQQAIKPGKKVPETNGEEANPEDIHVDNVWKEEEGQGSSSRSSDRASNGKRKYVSTSASRKKKSGEKTDTFKILAPGISLKGILDFLEEESQRQAARDDAFSKNVSALV